ncbi:aminodeoxychorismate lyase [Marinimicrobium sp. C6131]|uniref:aminodeoxychorismate lyase n=1 Tax=Marinimicrobium sp. C6131 TaxID=3022676 RepID=UPI00223DD42E|nr:aminodeoxychorismate lyase [Marinimicrobium sp. C6131]UZJ45499.1 aminodeoxychorismate lyase [Marinimicrobium sp. C6131]
MTDSELITLTNGEFGAGFSALDRGVAYGDGLFETARIRSGRVPLWPWHRERLIAGAQRLGMALDEERIEREKAVVLSRLSGTDGVLKLVVTRGVGGRAYQPPKRPLLSYSWQLRPGVSPVWEAGRDGVVLYECRHRLGDNPVLAGMKHLNRLEYVLARREWGDEYPEGLLSSGSGHVIEGTLSNVFVRLNDGWWTPQLDRNGVAGVMRRLVMDILGPKLNLAIQEGRITREALIGARECFVCNSVFGIWPVTGLAPGGETFSVGPQTRQLQRELEQWLTDHQDIQEVP